jgi:hypothetical protein
MARSKAGAKAPKLKAVIHVIPEISAYVAAVSEIDVDYWIIAFRETDCQDDEDEYNAVLGETMLATYAAFVKYWRSKFANCVFAPLKRMDIIDSHYPSGFPPG